MQPLSASVAATTGSKCHYNQPAHIVLLTAVAVTNGERAHISNSSAAELNSVLPL